MRSSPFACSVNGNHKFVKAKLHKGFARRAVN
jgi:hypothetical protein